MLGASYSVYILIVCGMAPLLSPCTRLYARLYPGLESGVNSKLDDGYNVTHVASKVKVR